VFILCNQNIEDIPRFNILNTVLSVLIFCILFNIKYKNIFFLTLKKLFCFFQNSKEIVGSYLIVKLMHLYTSTIVSEFLKALSKILQGKKKNRFKSTKEIY
jgi:hypothetical protein